MPITIAPSQDSQYSRHWLTYKPLKEGENLDLRVTILDRSLCSNNSEPIMGIFREQLIPNRIYLAEWPREKKEVSFLFKWNKEILSSDTVKLGEDIELIVIKELPQSGFSITFENLPDLPQQELSCLQ